MKTTKSTFHTPGKDRFYSVTSTAIGEVLLVSDGEALVELKLPTSPPWSHRAKSELRDDTLLAPVAQEIEGYLNGELVEFSTPLAPHGTSFQLAVWQALFDIEYGTTSTYGEVAANVGRPKASRAVGMANHVNPIALIVPCHRVIGSNGSLVGYGGGLSLKARLLELESKVIAAKKVT